MESNGSGRPSVHIPSTSRDSNATQLPDLVCVDTMVVNHSTRVMLLMGGDVWFLNSSVLTITDPSGMIINVMLSGEIASSGMGGSSLGLDAYVEENSLQISVGAILSMTGVEMSYDEATGILSITDGSGMITSALQGGMMGKCCVSYR